MTADLESVDSLDMYGATFSLAEQIEHAVEVASGVEGLPDAADTTAVVVMGMGGSGIGGDVAAAVASPAASVPVIVSKHYECPAWVGPGTVVFASSFSGNTEETVEAATAARAQGARVVVMASGGRLEELAGEWGVPFVRFDGSIPMPRAGIGAVSVTPLVLMSRMGLLSGVEDEVGAALEQVRRRATELRPGVPTGTSVSVASGSVASGSAQAGSEPSRDPASVIARRIGRTMPLVYGGGVLGEAAAWRWKGQFNENPKVPSWPNRVPELTHNEVAGWAVNGDVTRQVFTLVTLRHDWEHPQVQRRFSIIEEVCDEVVSDVVEVRAQGEGRLAQFMDLTLVGDVASLHVAVALGVDPGPIPLLDDIKARLRS